MMHKTIQITNNHCSPSSLNNLPPILLDCVTGPGEASLPPSLCNAFISLALDNSLRTLSSLTWERKEENHTYMTYMTYMYTTSTCSIILSSSIRSILAE